MATYAAYRHVELDNVGYGKKRLDLLCIIIFSIHLSLRFYALRAICLTYDLYISRKSSSINSKSRFECAVRVLQLCVRKCVCFNMPCHMRCTDSSSNNNNDEYDDKAVN
uniref:Uncharacterized protein n=1 Tax=Trichogramma kaykai TaxID=54128 RepID=A0ABD2XJU2_9HYME